MTSFLIHLRVGAVLAALALPALPVLAQAPAQQGVLRLLPPPSTTKHTLPVEGRTLEYTATAATLPLRDGKGETTAEIFHTAYTLEPASPARPLTFVFNGGPGAASAFLNLGALGPRRLAFSETGGFLSPPARLENNSDTWLEMTDLVFVDPVGTGYSRTTEGTGEADGRFYGVRQDADAMAAFIRLYLARSGRTASPVFLAGESYGGFRAAVLARRLQSEGGISPSGLFLISPALEFSVLRGDSYALLPDALLLPSLAAVHFERQGFRGRELQDRLREVERFALGDFLVHLASGAPTAAGPIRDALVRYTGLRPEVVERARGRISASLFIKEYDRANGRVLSRYDGTISAPDPDPSNPHPSAPDAVLDPAEPAWTTAFVQHAREELQYRTDVTYRLLNGEISGRWDYGTTPTRQGFAGSLDELQAARASNPAMEVMVAHGATDLVTTYLASRYLLDQLPPLKGAASIAFHVYGGGHMMYTRADSRRALKADARALFERALLTTGRKGL